jgi:ribonuclease Z
MPSVRTFTEIRLVNGSTGDPVLFIDYPGKDDAYLFDAGDLSALPLPRLADLNAVFLTHFHMDHFCGFDRVLRANLDRDKVLHVVGPDGTIYRLYERLKSYEIQHFPFQKVVFHVHEIADGKEREAMLECARRFPEPDITEKSWTGPIVYQNDDVYVEATPTDHTAPGLAYALVERVGYHPDSARLGSGLLRPGPWVEKVLAKLRAGEPEDTVAEIDGGKFTLGTLADKYFAKSRGGRIAFVTDTAWSEAVKPGLMKLAKKAQRLYCDSYYALADAKQATKHRHMTASYTAEFAKAAGVEQLILMHFAPRYAGHYEDLIEEARAIFPRTSAVLTPGVSTPA